MKPNLDWKLSLLTPETREVVEAFLPHADLKEIETLLIMGYRRDAGSLPCYEPKDKRESYILGGLGSVAGSWLLWTRDSNFHSGDYEQWDYIAGAAINIATYLLHH